MDSNVAHSHAAAVAMRWRLHRNCSLSPRQTAVAFGLISAVALTIALGFAMVGVTFILYFAGLELLALGLAWLVWGRHAGDGEDVTLHGHEVEVREVRAGRERLTRFPAAWLNVSVDAQGVWLRASGKAVCVGTLIVAPQRNRFALELRRALRAAP
jgi:uncharacterized membrane protein